MAQLHAAIARGNQKQVKRLLDEGADVNVEYEQRLPLHSALAFYAGYPDVTLFPVILYLLRSIAVLNAQNLFVDGRSMEMMRANDPMNEKYEFCRGELQLMKSKRVCSKSSVTYFDLLVKRHNALMRCLRCHDVRVALLHDDYATSQLPQYSEKIFQNCERGMKRLRMIQMCEELLHANLKSALPMEITNMICEYFSNDEIKKFVY